MKKVLRKKKRAYTKRSAYWDKAVVAQSRGIKLIEKVWTVLSILDGERFKGISELEKLEISTLLVAGYELERKESQRRV